MRHVNRYNFNEPCKYPLVDDVSLPPKAIFAKSCRALFFSRLAWLDFFARILTKTRKVAGTLLAGQSTDTETCTRGIDCFLLGKVPCYHCTLKYPYYLIVAFIFILGKLLWLQIFQHVSNLLKLKGTFKKNSSHLSEWKYCVRETVRYAHSLSGMLESRNFVSKVFWCPSDLLDLRICKFGQTKDATS